MRSILVSALLALPLLAQQRGGPPAVVSPEVHADRTVTFRVRAPKATDVSLNVDWQDVAQKLTKDAEGVWSITVGPLEPTTYIYSFNVDGIAMADPVNPRIKLRARGSGSLVDVPGSTSALWDFREVPHGEVNVNWHKSKVQNGALRSVWVYTPPGYDRDRKQKYPVLYLLHGSNDTPAGWTTVGNANFILDNMIAEKTIQPMIVVMPFGHAVPFGDRGANNNAVFEKY
ncbi:MAG TPA: alpha/beta hydrolase-fold protein, partial [Bryobacteraceae bacterium]|nr:alpha/beta hydrolase-fold protein [Bryobacteraceae bacterium]